MDAALVWHAAQPKQLMRNQRMTYVFRGVPVQFDPATPRPVAVALIPGDAAPALCLNGLNTSDQVVLVENALYPRRHARFADTTAAALNFLEALPRL